MELEQKAAHMKMLLVITSPESGSHTHFFYVQSEDVKILLEFCLYTVQNLAKIVILTQDL